VEFRRQIQRAVLCGIEDQTFGSCYLLGLGSRKPERSNDAPQRHDVRRLPINVEQCDLTATCRGAESIEQVLQVRCAREPFRFHHCGAAEVSELIVRRWFKQRLHR